MIDGPFTEDIVMRLEDLQNMEVVKLVYLIGYIVHP